MLSGYLRTLAKASAEGEVCTNADSRAIAGKASMSLREGVTTSTAPASVHHASTTKVLTIWGCYMGFKGKRQGNYTSAVTWLSQSEALVTLTKAIHEPSNRPIDLKP